MTLGGGFWLPAAAPLVRQKPPWALPCPTSPAVAVPLCLFHSPLPVVEEEEKIGTALRSLFCLALCYIALVPFLSAMDLKWQPEALLLGNK